MNIRPTKKIWFWCGGLSVITEFQQSYKSIYHLWICFVTEAEKTQYYNYTTTNTTSHETKC